MSKEEYSEMLDIRKELNAMETAIAAGYDIDKNEYERLMDEFAGYIDRYEEDVMLMDSELAEIFRLRYVLGLNFHTIMCVLYKNARSESTARKKIARFFEKGLA